ncbi:peptidylprolyl isomerase [bacterium]|nr:peptidylprolyl isomerase [bacterium]
MKQFITIFALAIVTVGCINSYGGINLGANRFFGTQEQDTDQNSALMNPEEANEEAPAEFKVKIVTTKGNIVLKVNREWSPNGADRFYNMVKIGYFEDIAIFRAIEGFMFQFGIHGDPKVSAEWRKAMIDDDPSVEGVSNQKGFITFAKSGDPNSRSVQFFINLGDNGRLDDMGFTPFGQVVEGMEIAEQINTEYGENKRGEQGKLQRNGNSYIKGVAPNIDFIKSISLIEDEE